MRTKAHVTWAKHDPRRMLVTCLGLSGAAELAHRRLCDHYWSTRRWARQDTTAFCELTRCSAADAAGVLEELRTVGWHTESNALINRDTKAVLDEAIRHQNRAVHRARKGAEQRWLAPKTPLPGAVPRQHPSQPMVPAPNEGPVAEPEQCSSNAQAMPEHPPSNAGASVKQCSSTADAMPKPCHYSTVHNSTVPNKAFNAERLTLSASPREKGSKAETRFLEQLQERLRVSTGTHGSLELKNWGGWWRNRFRDNPSKAQRVVDDVANMLKEGRIEKSFGAAAHDLWKRLPD